MLEKKKEALENHAHSAMDEYKLFITDFNEALQTPTIPISHGDGNGRVIAIDAPWGSGKSYFIDWYIQQSKEPAKQEVHQQSDEDKQNSLYCIINPPPELDNAKSTHIPFLFSQITAEERQPVSATYINYNAWEHDSAEDPLVSLVSQIYNEFKKKLEPSHLERIGTLVTAAAKFLVKPILTAAVASCGVAVEAASVVVDGANEVIQEGKKAFQNNLEALIKENYDSLKQEFKEALKTIAKDKPLVIFIDDLDRCKPTFAIALLERVKHFFNVEGVTFVFALDSKALKKTIGHAYGLDEESALKYLEKFFNYSFNLPYRSAQFIKMVVSSALEQHCKEAVELYCQRDTNFTQSLSEDIARLCIVINLTPRDALLVLGEYFSVYGVIEQFGMRDQFNMRDRLSVTVLYALLKVRYSKIYDSIEAFRIERANYNRITSNGRIWKSSVTLSFEGQALVRPDFAKDKKLLFDCLQEFLGSFYKEVKDEWKTRFIDYFIAVFLSITYHKGEFSEIHAEAYRKFLKNPEEFQVN